MLPPGNRHSRDSHGGNRAVHGAEVVISTTPTSRKPKNSSSEAALATAFATKPNTLNSSSKLSPTSNNVERYQPDPRRLKPNTRRLQNPTLQTHSPRSKAFKITYRIFICSGSCIGTDRITGKVVAGTANMASILTPKSSSISDAKLKKNHPNRSFKLQPSTFTVHFPGQRQTKRTLSLHATPAEDRRNILSE